LFPAKILAGFLARIVNKSKKVLALVAAEKQNARVATSHYRLLHVLAFEKLKTES
jgi:hypothetical protein